MIRHRHFDKSERIVDKSTQTRCNDSDDVSDVGKFRQSDTESSIVTCNPESNAGSYWKYPERKTRLPGRYASFEVGHQNQKRFRTDQTAASKSSHKTNESLRNTFSFKTNTPFIKDQRRNPVYQKGPMSISNKGELSARNRKNQYQQLSWHDAAMGRPSVKSLRTIGCHARAAAQAETASSALIGQRQGSWPPQAPPPRLQLRLRHSIGRPAKYDNKNFLISFNNQSLTRTRQLHNVSLVSVSKMPKRDKNWPKGEGRSQPSP